MATQNFHIPGEGREWNLGYADGYYGRKPPITTGEAYDHGYMQGTADRAEDEEAIASGEFDLLTKEERELVYGDESDRI